MSILIKGIDMPSKDELKLFEEDSHIVISGHLFPIELDQLVEIDDTTISKPRDSQGRFSCGEVDKWADIESLEGEEWKPIKGYEDRYKVSNMGRVRSKAKILSQGGKIYKHVTLNNGDVNHRSTRTVHTLVAKAFIPNPEGLQYINHKDYDTHNNRADNLEWCTASYNIKYSWERRKQNAPTILEAER